MPKFVELTDLVRLCKALHNEQQNVDNNMCVKACLYRHKYCLLSVGYFVILLMVI